MASDFPTQLPDLPHALWALLAQVPQGRVTTYGDLAGGLGARIAARWVGQVMLHHEHSAGCLCHRVVRADGRLGGYAAGTSDDKARRLAAEGVDIDDGRVDLARFGFHEFHGSRPLELLRQLQQTLVEQVEIAAPAQPPELAAGVDVSYVGATRGVAAYALVEVATGELVWSTTVSADVRFPYISTFLSFRELPLLLKLVDAARAAHRLADVVLVDGSGILHQRHAGIATHLGVLTGLSTIGVTKKLLCGEVDLAALEYGAPSPIAQDGDGERPVIGSALLTTPRTRRPIFISPGHRVDVASATAVVQQLLAGRRLPEPIYWADRISRTAARELKGR
jgi:deoxyribonuclease V